MTTEDKIEQAHVDGVIDKGGKSFKTVSPGFDGFPDRLDLYPVAYEHIDIVAKYVRFTELKAPGKKAKTRQARVHTTLRGMGFVVNVIDSKGDE